MEEDAHALEAALFHLMSRDDACSEELKAVALNVFRCIGRVATPAKRSGRNPHSRRGLPDDKVSHHVNSEAVSHHRKMERYESRVRKRDRMRRVVQSLATNVRFDDAMECSKPMLEWMSREPQLPIEFLKG